MTSSKTKARELVLGPKAILEFFKPARLEIYECLQVTGPASIAELADRLGRAPDSLYYHVRKLVELRVLAPIEDEATGLGSPGRNGAIYELTAKRVQGTLDHKSRASRDAWAHGASSVLRLASRDIESALDSGETRVEGVDRNLSVTRMKARLKKKDLRRVNKLVDELFSILGEHSASTDGALYALTCAFSSVKERKR